MNFGLLTPIPQCGNRQTAAVFSLNKDTSKGSSASESGKSTHLSRVLWLIIHLSQKKFNCIKAFKSGITLFNFKYSAFLCLLLYVFLLDLEKGREDGKNPPSTGAIDCQDNRVREEEEWPHHDLQKQVTKKGT